MKTLNETKKNKYSSLYWSEKYPNTQKRLDDVGRRFKRSRVGSIDFLLNYFEEGEKRRTTPILL